MTPMVVVEPAGLRPREAARYIGVSPTFLRGLPVVPVRVRGTGKKPLVIYLRTDLDAWLANEAAKRDPLIRTRAQRAS